jgi:hypothetical protein
MSIKQLGGVFGRNPTFNDVTIEGQLTFDGDIDVNSDLKVDGDLEVTGSVAIGPSTADTLLHISGDATAIVRLENTNPGLGLDDVIGSIEFEKQDGSGAGAGVAGSMKLITSNNNGAESSLVFSTCSTARGNNAEAARFTSSGNGIDFSATAGAGTSELFDDYEEGSWVPVIADASAGGNAASATVDGDYVKVGNSVTVTCAINNIDTTGLTAGNDVYIIGFPFVAKDLSTTGKNSGAIGLANVTFSGYVTLELRDGQQYGRFSENVSGTSNDYIIVSELTSSSDVFFSYTYITE